MTARRSASLGMAHAVALILGLLGPLTALAAEPVIWIGIRKDTPPFAWQEASGAFRGYLRDICVEAVTRAGYTFEQVPITAEQRIGVLDGDPTIDVEGKGKITLDLVCDPTTISLQRLETLAARAEPELLTFSPILFVANGSYVKRAKSDARNAKVDGAYKLPAGCEFLDMPAPENATEAARVAVLDAYFADNPDYFVFGYVEGTTSRANILRGAAVGNPRLGTSRMCLMQFPSHAEGVQALCNDQVDYYYGDLDIIEAYQARALAAPNKKCAIVRAEQPLSYEPYALLVSSATRCFRPRFITKLYEMFSDGTVDSRFTSYFPKHTKSSALILLMRINSIPGLRDGAAAGASAQGDAQGGGPGEGCQGGDEQGQAAQ